MNTLIKSIWFTSTLFSVASYANNLEKVGVRNEPETIQELMSGNSLLIVNSYGPGIYHFDANGQFKSYNPEARLDTIGNWREKNNSLCMTVTSQPFNANPNPHVKEPKEYCMKMEVRPLGSSWSGQYPARGTIRYKLLEGHQTILEAIRGLKDI